MIENNTSCVSSNQFTFECPTVKRAARFVVCAFKRHKQARGENFADQDCKCAMAGGKCPVYRMIKKEWLKDERLYYSTSAEVKKCPQDIAEEVEKIILFPFQARGLTLSDEQKTVLFGKVVEIPTAPIVEDDPTKSTEPTRSSKPKAKRASSRDVKEDAMSALAEGVADTATVFNEAMGLTS